MSNINVDTPSVSQEPVWNGYTIDELKYQRAIALVKLELQKEVLENSVKGLNASVITTNNKYLSSIFKGKFTGKLRYVNYLITGYKVSKMFMYLWKSFRKK